MIDDLKAAAAEWSEGLARLESRLGERKRVPALVAAKGLVELDAIRKKLVKLAASLESADGKADR